MAEPTISVATVALALVRCPRCGAKEGDSCAATLRRLAERGGDETAAAELARIDELAPQLMHPQRYTAAEDLIDSAVAYGLVRRVPGGASRACATPKEDDCG